MSAAPLSLGTAQLGLPYGVANRRGLPSIAFRNDGRTHRRFPTASVLAWLRSEAEKEGGES